MGTERAMAHCGSSEVLMVGGVACMLHFYALAMAVLFVTYYIAVSHHSSLCHACALCLSGCSS